jgi:23S rRNA (cytosine1962-C5)-methyltransferase
MRDVVLRGGPPVHPWVYSKRVHHVQDGVRDGDVVRLRTREGRPCGYGLWHSRSLIAVRVLVNDAAREPDEAWLRERIRAAARLRVEVLRLPEITDAWRVVHAEADGLSGLVVDRYGPAAVVGLFSLGWYRRLDEVTRVLKEELGVSQVIARADDRTCLQEGFRPPPTPRAGSVEIHERGVAYLVDLAGGHKTGFFLDQRENRALIARLAKGRRVFDGMTYTGGFALAAAKGGAASVVAVDLDEEALEVAHENAKRNDARQVTFRHGDVFDALRALESGPPDARPEVLIVDPAKWAKDRAGLRAALAKYRDLNRLAISAVADGGVVLTCSCSGLVSEDDFLGVLKATALDLRRDLRFVYVGGAAPDHPVSSSFPEGRYLKAVLVAPGPRDDGPGRSKDPAEEQDREASAP